MIVEEEQVKPNLAGMIEAMIFASPEPLSCAQIKEVFDRLEMAIAQDEIEDVLLGLKDKWQDENRPNGQGFELIHVAGGYAFRSNPHFGNVVRAFLQEKPQKLTPPQLEVLSIIAYRQPVTRLEIEEIRGVDCSASMRKLLNVKLIKILGKSEGLGRPLLYGTTKNFLAFFGFNSLHDLPTVRDHQELNKESQAELKDDKDMDVTIRDLFTPGENQSMFSESTERLSLEAMESLEKALSVVTEAAKKIEAQADAVDQ